MITARITLTLVLMFPASAFMMFVQVGDSGFSHHFKYLDMDGNNIVNLSMIKWISAFSMQTHCLTVNSTN